MNDKLQASPILPTNTKLVGDERDRIQIEFLIEDLVKQLVKDRIGQVASCNGCNSCSASVSRVNPALGR